MKLHFEMFGPFQRSPDKSSDTERIFSLYSLEKGLSQPLSFILEWLPVGLRECIRELKVKKNTLSLKLKHWLDDGVGLGTRPGDRRSQACRAATLITGCWGWPLRSWPSALDGLKPIRVWMPPDKGCLPDFPKQLTQQVQQDSGERLRGLIPLSHGFYFGETTVFPGPGSQYNGKALSLENKTCFANSDTYTPRLSNQGTCTCHRPQAATI